MRRERTIIISDKPQHVLVRRLSVSRWAAQGQYGGQRIEVTGANEQEALQRWRDIVRSRG
jgi:hypothetical protein